MKRRVCLMAAWTLLVLVGRGAESAITYRRIEVTDKDGMVAAVGPVPASKMPLWAKDGKPPHPRSIGGDEVAIMNCLQVAVHTDKRLFISDIGNDCIRSVKLGYHVSERVKVGR